MTFNERNSRIEALELVRWEHSNGGHALPRKGGELAVAGHAVVLLLSASHLDILMLLLREGVLPLEVSEFALLDGNHIFL
jgi:hypothetical protein